MPDQLADTFESVDAAGNTTFNFTGHVHAAGLDLDAAKGVVDAQHSVTWLSQADGSDVGHMTVYTNVSPMAGNQRATMLLQARSQNQPADARLSAIDTINSTGGGNELYVQARRPGGSPFNSITAFVDDDNELTQLSALILNSLGQSRFPQMDVIRGIPARGDLLAGNGAVGGWGSLALGGDNLVLMSDSSQTLGVRWGRSVERLADLTLGANGNIDFLNIPQTYSHLLCIFSGRAINSGGNTTVIRFRINNDSGNQYNFAYMQIAAGAFASAVVAAATSVDIAAVADVVFDSQRTRGFLLFPNYAITTDRIGYLTTATGYDGFAHISFRGGRYFAFNNLSRLTLFTAAGTLDVGSRATLYGLG